jgi:hypothetical protein
MGWLTCVFFADYGDGVCNTGAAPGCQNMCNGSVTGGIHPNPHNRVTDHEPNYVYMYPTVSRLLCFYLVGIDIEWNFPSNNQKKL